MRLRRLLVTSLAALGMLAPAAAAKPKQKPPSTVTVMTRNLYLGTDITRPITAVTGKSGLAALVAFGNANFQARAIVDQTDFGARAKLLAAEIAASKPDLVGLQEVATWRRGPYEFGALGQSNAPTVEIDFLKLLRAELKQRKAPYAVVRKQQEADVEGPSFPGADPSVSSSDVRLTIHDVLLRRKGSKVVITRRFSQNYVNELVVGFSGISFTFKRGLVGADARLGKKKFRIIDTHLESQGVAFTQAQAQELLTGPAAVTGRPVIVTCDCNSDPDTTSAAANVPDKSAYQTLTGQAPYSGIGGLPLTDAGDPGPTSGFNETVDDADTKGLTKRIDLILTRGTRTVSIKRTGITKRTPGGLWPSDHAGVIAKLKL